MGMTKGPTAGTRPMPADASYIIQGGSKGSDRLNVLANATWPTSREFLVRAGLRAGMSCLDVGCGNGEISVRLANLIGGYTSVLGVDRDSAKIHIARQKARELGLSQSRFEVCDVMEALPALGEKFDFVYLRFLLSHLTDPQVLLMGVREYLRPGGIIAVEDVEFDGHYSTPANKAFDRYVQLYVAAAKKRGADANIGPKLAQLIRGAGYVNVNASVINPVFTDGDGKQMALITMDAISEAVTSAGLVTRDEVREILAELERFTTDQSSSMSIPRLHQVSGKVV